MASTRTLFLSGDVMTGRGVDQILGRPSDPALWEPHSRDARDYVELAERASGPIPKPVPAAWVWGDALGELDRAAPDVRIVNLETTITSSDDHWPGKHIHYRMHPDNIASLTAARIDACVLANNHVLDFGYAGLAETLAILRTAGIATAGAGADLEAARRPAVVGLGPKGRVVVVAAGTFSSGVPRSWAASDDRPGVHLLPNLSDAAADELAATASAGRRPDDVLVASIHRGSNWGYRVPPDQVRFAHRLVEAGVDVVHGHSSHHPRPIEIYRGRLILYGCGDLINDCEGIGGYEAFRGDLALLYLPTVLGDSGELVELRMVPVRIRRMRLERASPEDARWLGRVLRSTSGPSASATVVDADHTLVLRPPGRAVGNRTSPTLGSRDHVGAGVEAGAPDHLEQLLPGEHLPGVANECGEEGQLTGRKRHFASGEGSPVGMARRRVRRGLPTMAAHGGALHCLAGRRDPPPPRGRA